MNTFKKIKKAIAARIPGTALNIASQKRQLEQKLRTDGWSRSAAVTEAAKRFKEGKHA